MLNKEEFYQELAEEIRGLIVEGAEVSLHRIPKNNGITLDALSIMMPGEYMAPTIYLDSCYRKYLDGISVGEIAARVIVENSRMRTGSEYPVNIPDDLPSVWDTIRYRLINYELNAEMLKEMPHVRYLDLAKIYYYAVKLGEDEYATAVVRYCDLEDWELSEEDLDEQAERNTPENEPARVEPITQVIEDIRQGFGTDEEEEEIPSEGIAPIYILSNRSRFYGASCLLYSGILRSFSDFTKTDLFILPSSIHELILLPDNGIYSSRELGKMVSEINHTQVMPTEVLSDHVYHYSRSQDQITIKE